MSEELEPDAPLSDARRFRLRADCERCVGLCCVAPAFSASADFAIDKDAGQACPNLQSDFRCAIHTRLRQEGFPGCAVYDCFGAGQKVTQVTVGGHDWQRTPQIAAQSFEVFAVMRQLHELLWYLTEALTLQRARPLYGELSLALDDTERLTQESVGALVELDLASHRRDVNSLLLRTSELVRAEAHRHVIDRRGADLIWADLRGANLRGAYLIGADLKGVDLRTADLTESIFLTQSQLDSAKGDLDTKLPPSLTRPTHWPPSATSAAPAVRA